MPALFTLKFAMTVMESLDVDDLEALTSAALARLDELRPVDPNTDVLTAVGEPLTRQDLEDAR